VFDRYGLVVMPGLCLFAGIGWQAACSARRPFLRAAAAVALAASSIATGYATAESQRVAGETDVSLLARNWILEHVRPGSRVARHNEDNTFLPRTREQLDACADAIDRPEAYTRKLQVLGMADRPMENEPMRAAVLNDEMFQAYWCRRERSAATDRGFTLIPYHPEPRYGSVLERDAIDDFRTGVAGSSPGQSLDVLVMNRPVDVGIPPAAVLRTSRGERVIYVRPGAQL
jgi:hypothetical protein